MCHGAVELGQREVGVRHGIAATVVVHVHGAAGSTGVVVGAIDIGIGVAIVGAGSPACGCMDVGARAVAVEVFEEGQSVDLGARDEEVDDGIHAVHAAYVDNLHLIVGTRGEGGECVGAGCYFTLKGP